VEVLEFEDLGMEAVWKIEVEDFPAFIVINHEGKDFYADLTTQRSSNLIQVGD
jgi:fumarate hydratase class I